MDKPTFEVIIAAGADNLQLKQALQTKHSYCIRTAITKIRSVLRASKFKNLQLTEQQKSDILPYENDVAKILSSYNLRNAKKYDMINYICDLARLDGGKIIKILLTL